MRFVVCNEAPATGRTSLEATVGALTELGQTVASHVLGPDGVWVGGGAPETGVDDWLHVGSGACVEEPASSVLRDLVRRADGAASWHMHLPVAAADPDDFWEPVEEMLAAIGTQGGLVFVDAAEVRWLCRDDELDAVELAGYWAAEHGLALVVCLDDDGSVVAVKPDGRHTRLAAAAVAATAGNGQRRVARFLARWVADPSDLDAALGSMGATDSPTSGCAAG